MTAPRDPETTTSIIVKVSATSRPTAVAGAIAGIMRESHLVEIRAIGAAAVNQAVKAIAIARTYLVDDEIDLFCTPNFHEVEINGETRTAMRFTVEQRDWPRNA